VNAIAQAAGFKYFNCLLETTCFT